jgi:hypothetical protein
VRLDGRLSRLGSGIGRSRKTFSGDDHDGDESDGDKPNGDNRNGDDRDGDNPNGDMKTATPPPVLITGGGVAVSMSPCSRRRSESPSLLSPFRDRSAP